ncbi:MAG: hypothetical protein HOK41_04500 [Nitrospina sp.]|nr:hypothetical protein [Nitrospina sp.]
MTLQSSPIILFRMKHIAFTFLFFTMIAAPAYAMSEAEYQKEWCAKHNGEIDYKTQESSTVDCLTDNYSIEFDFAEKWVQAMKKSRHQSLSTGKAPGVVLILQNSADEKYLFKLREVVEKRRLGIKIWAVGRDVELPCDIKGDVDNDGDKIYHIIGQQMYDATVVNPRQGETWFCSYEEAEEAGWKPFLKAKPINIQELGGWVNRY